MEVKLTLRLKGFSISFSPVTLIIHLKGRILQSVSMENGVLLLQNVLKLKTEQNTLCCRFGFCMLASLHISI